MSSPTVRDVAVAAGSSVSTVSRVLSGARAHDDDVARRIRRAAAELGYSASVMARALRGEQSLVTVIADDVGTETMGEIVFGMESAARVAGVLVTVSASGGDPRQRVAALRVLRSMRPRAVVLTGSWLDDAELQQDLQTELDAYTSRDGGRVVVIGGPRPPYTTIGFDDYGSALLVGEHMANLGRTSALILSGPPDHVAFQARTRAFAAALKDAGIVDVRIAPSAMTRDGAATALAEALGGGTPGLVLAGNDVIALGALAELRRRGTAVPADVAVSGFDGIPFALDQHLGVTTVALPFARMGRMALALAIDDEERAHKELRGHLVVRSTSG